MRPAATEGGVRVVRTVYRSFLRHARTFDRHPAAKAVGFGEQCCRAQSMYAGASLQIETFWMLLEHRQLSHSFRTPAL
jgi:hypothetical protein